MCFITLGSIKNTKSHRWLKNLESSRRILHLVFRSRRSDNRLEDHTFVSVVVENVEKQGFAHGGKLVSKTCNEIWQFS